MEHYRKSSHTVYDLKYHVVWITKYRKPVLRSDVSERERDLIREICKANDVEIIWGHVSRDHVHIFVSVPPHISISQLYTVSQRVRKRAEEIFGWMKTVGNFRKTRHRGIPLVEWMFTLTAVAYNLVRIRNILAAQTS